MSSPDRLALLGAALLLATSAAPPPARGPDLGTPLMPAEERLLDITVMPDGTGLPPGQGTATAGARVFAEQCEACHGPAGAKPIGQIPALTGGIGTLASPRPLRTANSYWPYAPLLFDYIRRAMPPTAPGSLTADQTYAVTAYILSVDSLVAPGTAINATELSKLRMPNREGFVPAAKATR